MRIRHHVHTWRTLSSPWPSQPHRPAPERNELLTPPLTKRFGFANRKDPEQVRREEQEEAQHQAEFDAAMSAGRQLHEEGLLVRDAVEAAVLFLGAG